MSPAQNTKTETIKAEIVIIGGGGAGLTAAVGAAEAGAKSIVVLEKAAALGGNTDLCHGIFAVESPAQKRLGIKATRDEVFKKQMDHARWTIDPRLVRTVINKSGEMIQWLEDRGVKFNAVVGEFLPGGGSFFHMLNSGPQAACGHSIVEALVKACRSPGINTLYETAAKKILTDDKGAVKGVLAQAKDKELLISCKCVIIAAGGFGANKDMLNKYLPLRGNVPIQSLPQMTGDGIVMAEEAGAFTNDNFSILAVGPSYYTGTHAMYMLSIRPELMLVNKNGERFADESLLLNTHNYSANSLSRQPDAVCYALLDSEVVQTIIRKRDNLSGFFKSVGQNGIWMDQIETDLKDESAKGNIKTAMTWDEIAAWLKLASSTLKATVAEYNSYCEKSYDADFLKDKRFLLPLKKPPYYAIPCGQAYDTTTGGIRINHRMEVIDKQVRPIRGLYAAGDNAGSWLSDNYDLAYPGAALSFALCSGYIAGANAAKFING